MGIDLTKDEMKNRILNYLDYLSEKDHQEILVTLYNIAKRRKESKKFCMLYKILKLILR